MNRDDPPQAKGRRSTKSDRVEAPKVPSSEFSGCDPTALRAATDLVGQIARDRDTVVADWFRPLLSDLAPEVSTDLVLSTAHRRLQAHAQLLEHNNDLVHEVSALRRDFVMLDQERARMIQDAADREARILELERGNSEQDTVAQMPESPRLQHYERMHPDDLEVFTHASKVVVRAAYLVIFLIAILSGVVLISIGKGLIK